MPFNPGSDSLSGLSDVAMSGLTNGSLLQYDTTSGKWVDVTGLVPQSGPTGARPASPATGLLYFDTTLNQPVWWSGSAWVDAGSVSGGTPATQTVYRHVHLNGPEYGLSNPTGATQSFSQNNLGTYNTDFHYESQASLTYFASRGVKSVKVPIRWERITPVLGGPLESVELGRLTSFLDRCETAGLKAVVDIHNYGVYYWDDPAVSGTQGSRRAVGSAEVTVAHFSDMWSRLATAIKNHPAIVGGGAYAIMAEPQSAGGLTRATWQSASQAAVTAIRGVDTATQIHVAGWDYSVCENWATVNGSPWINDPNDNFKYEAHHYWDDDNSGGYSRTYAQELALAQNNYTAGSYTDAFTNKVITELNEFNTWLTDNSVEGIVGEFGWPASESPALWNALAETYLTRCDTIRMDTAFWSAGEWSFGGTADMLLYKGDPQSTTNNQSATHEAHPTFTY